MTKNYTQSEDFKEESISLYEILQDQKDEVFSSKTQFKDWTINDVLYHLHVFNNAAYLSFTNVFNFSVFKKVFF